MGFAKIHQLCLPMSMFTMLHFKLLQVVTVFVAVVAVIVIDCSKTSSTVSNQVIGSMHCFVNSVPSMMLLVKSSLAEL